MRTAILTLLFCLAAQAQISYNPFTRRFDFGLRKDGNGNYSIGAPLPAANPPAGSINVQGNIYKNGVEFQGGSGGALEYGMTICSGGCYENETSEWKRPFPSGKTITGCIGDADVYPTGADLIIDVLKNGTSVFSAPGKMTFAAGATTWVKQTAMAAAAAGAEGDSLKLKVVQPGSTVAGSRVTVVCTVE
jgi:hypothetical protein